MLTVEEEAEICMNCPLSACVLDLRKSYRCPIINGSVGDKKALEQIDPNTGKMLYRYYKPIQFIEIIGEANHSAPYQIYRAIAKDKLAFGFKWRTSDKTIKELLIKNIKKSRKKK